MQKARGRIAASTACKRMVSGSIALRFLRFFSPFLHSTGSLSVSCSYLALPDGAGSFTQGFTSLALLRIHSIMQNILIHDFHALWYDFPNNSNSFYINYECPTTPISKLIGLGSSAFARHYLRNHYYFLFLEVLRCFSSLSCTLYGAMSST
jgi:hypothetical protein